MGFLGAMVGLGKGVQDYATTMKDKAKQDWEAQQETVKHERTMNLRRLSETGLDRRQGLLLGAQAEQGALGREATAELTAAQQAHTRELQELRGEQAIEQVGATGAGKIKTARGLQDIEDEVSKKAWEETVNSQEYKELPEGLKRLTAVQFSISGDVDLAKLLAGMGSTGMGGTGSKLKSPSAKHWEFAMDKLMEWKPYEKLSPPAQLAMSAKIASQAANNQPIEFGGDVLNPDKYAKYAQKIADGKMTWGDVRNLDSDSINGIGLEYEKLHPSTKLSYKIQKPPKRVGVMRGRGDDVDLTGFESGAEGLSAGGIYSGIKGTFEGLRRQGAQ